MIAWLLDTLWWTGVLMAAVLLARHPVARLCGARAAYALWALVLLRAGLPPLLVLASPVVAGAGVAASGPHVAVLSLWLGGAAGFLGWRIVGYRRMRSEILAGARPVGEDGAIRLFESARVRVPVAFGVFDKVVALPEGFMSQPDRTARDFAIAHELAHHRGHDLLANMAAQAVLALHWFNPLAWLAWKLSRRDQEAACDARVLVGRGADERAAYAAVISRFAGRVPQALGAPLACAVVCPGLGRAAIIERLQVLARGEAAPLRHRSGLALLLAAACTLPLSATLIPVALPAMPMPPAPQQGVEIAQVSPLPVIRQPRTGPVPLAPAEAGPASALPVASLPERELAVVQVAPPSSAEVEPQLVAVNWSYAISLENRGVVQSAEWLVVLSAPPRAPAIEEVPPSAPVPVPAVVLEDRVLAKKLAALASSV